MKAPTRILAEAFETREMALCRLRLLTTPAYVYFILTVTVTTAGLLFL